jgi:hypothetical protein
LHESPHQIGSLFGRAATFLRFARHIDLEEDGDGLTATSRFLVQSFDK